MIKEAGVGPILKKQYFGLRKLNYAWIVPCTYRYNNNKRCYLHSKLKSFCLLLLCCCYVAAKST